MGLIKKNKVSADLSDYSVCMLGTQGIGKTTLMKETCEKEFGEDGYVIFNMGSEQGIDCIEGAAYIDIPDYKTLVKTIKELVANKDTEYKDIKIIVYDTIDQLFELTEAYAVQRWNQENINEKNFKPATTVNGIYGGFGKGLDKVIEFVIDSIIKLQNAGYRVWYTGHLNQKTLTDAITNETYTQLTASLTQRYFNAIKDRMHIVGVCCIDRTIETEGLGRKNIVTHQEETINKVKGERRKIVFRDDNFTIDAKSRFKDICPQIDLNTDEFINALKDAIKASKSNTFTEVVKETKPIAVTVEEKVIEDIIDDEEEIDEIDDLELDDEDIPEVSIDLDSIRADIRVKFKASDAAKKKEIKGILAKYNGTLDECPLEGLNEIKEIL